MAYTTIDDPSLYFRVKTYSGSSSDGNAVTWDETHANMQPDWLWLKNRTAAQEHWLADSVRGTGKFLESNSGNVESSDGASGLASFDTNGFTLNDSARTNRNTMVGWGWKAETSFSNSAGANGADLASSGSYNRDAGFSIVTFTGNATANQQIYHGLNSVPVWMVLKNRTNSNNESWSVYHQSIGNTKKITLDTTATPSTSNEFWEDTTPTSTVFTVGRQDAVNGSGNTHVVYCFSEVKGYSKFTSFTGNGSSDGPFVYLGFRASFVIIKRTDTTANWQMYDNKRDGYNGPGYPAKGNESLRPNTSEAESSATGYDIDILSNGIKLRNSSSTMNSSGASHIVMAFAESPFVTSTGIPTTAR